MCRGLCQGRDMAQEVSVIVSDDDRVRLEAIVKERNHSHKHVQRAQIVLLSADRLAVADAASVAHGHVVKSEHGCFSLARLMQVGNKLEILTRNARYIWWSIRSHEPAKDTVHWAHLRLALLLAYDADIVP